jgi:glyoxylase-like metal-dependent hydrolase (beta-lactamase superfamily II)
MRRDRLLAIIFVASASAFTGAGVQAAPVDLIEQAVRAEGGAEALRKLERIAIKAEAQHWEPEQSYLVEHDARLLATSKLSIQWDLVNGAARTEWDRNLIYPSRGSDKYTDVLTGKSGFIVTAKGERPMSSIRVASEERELSRTSPIFLLKALAAPEHLHAMKDQRLGTESLPAVSFDEGSTEFIILFDRITHLPAAIRTLDDDNLLGDANYDVAFSNWQTIDGVLIAHTLTQRLEGVDVGKIVYTDVTVNPAIDAGIFKPSEKLSGELEPPATGTIPYQWVLRRISLGRFTDSDAVNYDSATSSGLKLVEITPNIQHVVGGTHNSLIVAMPNFLVVFDAPINEWQSRWTIDAAKKKYPNKPIKYLVLTHQHNDHTGGSRLYVAEGATVVVSAPSKAYFEKVFSAPHTVNPDRLQGNPKPAKIVEVVDRMSIKDGDDEIRLYKIANPHTESMMIGHVVGGNVVFVTDLYSPTRDKVKNEWVVAFDRALTKYDIKPAVIAGGHGGTAPASELEGLMSQN